MKNATLRLPPYFPFRFAKPGELDGFVLDESKPRAPKPAGLIAGERIDPGKVVYVGGDGKVYQYNRMH